MTKIQVVYDTRLKNVALLGGNKAGEDFLLREKAAVAVVMTGLQLDARPGAPPALEEIARRLAYLVAEKTGGPVHVHHGTGRVVSRGHVGVKTLLDAARARN